MAKSNPRRRRAADETRSLLLETAYDMLMSRGFTEKIDIRLADVVKKAGHTTGAAYQHWSSQADFQRDLALHIASEPAEWAGVETIGDDLLAFLAGEPSFEEMVQEAGRLYMNAFLGREQFFTMLYFYSIRDRAQQLTDSMSLGYDRIHEEFRELFSALLELYDRQMREPFELDDLCVAASALAEGMALRHRVQPERVEREIGLPNEAPWHQFSAALVAVGLHYTKVKGSEES